MIIDLKDLENSKIYVNPKSEIYNFKHPMDYLGFFLEKFPNSIIKVEVGSVNKEQTDESENTAYSRVIVQAKLEQSLALQDTYFDFLEQEIGITYALDTQNPAIKIYRGARVTACTNGCIFGATNVDQVLLKSDLSKVVESTERYVDTQIEHIKLLEEKVHTIQEQSLTRDELNTFIGNSLFYSKINKHLGVNTVLGVVDLIQDNKNPVYSLKDEKINKWTLYNAYTEKLKGSNIFDESTKIQLLEKLFLN